MKLENSLMFNRKYIFIYGGFSSDCHVSELGVLEDLVWNYQLRDSVRFQWNLVHNHIPGFQEKTSTQEFIVFFLIFCGLRSHKIRHHPTPQKWENFFGWNFLHPHRKSTLPETAIAPENWGLGDEIIFGKAYFIYFQGVF